VPRPRLGRLENHPAREEVRAALTAEPARIVPRSETLGLDLLDFAVPARRQAVGVLREAHPLTPRARHNASLVFGRLTDVWGTMDFLVHAIAYSDKAELTGRYADTSRTNFLKTMDISC
jgi:enoyl-[acyl-carrier-protein] reductase (NADH)